MPLFRSAIPGNKTVTEAKLADSLSGILAFRTGALTQYSLTRVGADGKTLGDSGLSDNGSLLSAARPFDAKTVTDNNFAIGANNAAGNRAGGLHVASTGYGGFYTYDPVNSANYTARLLGSQKPSMNLHYRAGAAIDARYNIYDADTLAGWLAFNGSTTLQLRNYKTNGSIFMIMDGTGTFLVRDAAGNVHGILGPSGLAVGASFVPGAKVESRSTTGAQHRESYSGSVYCNRTVNSSGNLVEAITGSQRTVTLAGATREYILSTGRVIHAPATALSGSSLFNNSIHPYLDESGGNLVFLYKKSDGTTGTVTMPFD